MNAGSGVVLAVEPVATIAPALAWRAGSAARIMSTARVAGDHPRRRGDAGAGVAVLARSVSRPRVGALNRFSTKGHRQAAAPGALWAPVGRGSSGGAAPLARPSLTAPLHRRLRRRAAEIPPTARTA